MRIYAYAHYHMLCVSFAAGPGFVPSEPTTAADAQGGREWALRASWGLKPDQELHQSAVLQVQRTIACEYSFCSGS